MVVFRAGKVLSGIVIFLLFALIGLGAGFVIRAQQDTDSPRISGDTETGQSPSVTAAFGSGSPVPTMTFAVPRDSLTGELTAVEGDVGIFKRGEQDFQDAQVGDTFVIPESLRTGSNSSVTVTFPDMGSLVLGEESNIASVSLLRSNMTMEQRAGTVAYTVDNPDEPISVRYTGAVIQIAGSAVVSMDTNTATVSVTQEQTTIALLGSDNNTKVRTLETGMTAIVDPEDQIIQIQEPDESDSELEPEPEDNEDEEGEDVR